MKDETGKKYRERWRRLLADEDFQSELAELRRELGIPMQGFGDRAAYGAWLKALGVKKEKQALEKEYTFVRKMIDDHHLEKHDVFFELALYSFLHGEKEEGLGFDRPYGSSVVDVRALLEEGRIEALKHLAQENVFVLIGPDASKRDVLAAIRRPGTWGLIEFLRRRLGFRAPERVYTRSQREKHEAIYDLFRKGIIKRDGEILSGLPDKMKWVREIDRDTRRRIIDREKKKRVNAGGQKP